MENKPKYTPGPWKAEKYQDRIAIQKTSGVHIAQVMLVDDAALIAAGPELLEACQAIMKAEAMQQGKRDGGTMAAISIAIDSARAAIAKAEGGHHA